MNGNAHLTTVDDGGRNVTTKREINLMNKKQEEEEEKEEKEKKITQILKLET